MTCRFMQQCIAAYLEMGISMEVSAQAAVAASDGEESKQKTLVSRGDAVSKVGARRVMGKEEGCDGMRRVLNGED